MVKQYYFCSFRCRMEPFATASQTFYANLCEREITLRDQRRFANCFQQFADSPSGKKCIDPYNGVDKLAPDAGERMCSTIDKILQCSAWSLNRLNWENSNLLLFLFESNIQKRNDFGNCGNLLDRIWLISYPSNNYNYGKFRSYFSQLEQCWE